MNNNNHQHQNMQTGSGLTRYRSAPSSYFATLLTTPAAGDDGAGFGADDFEQLFNPRASSPETQRIFSRFMNSASDSIPQFPPPRKAAEPEVQQLQLQRQQSNDYSSVSQAMYNSDSANSRNNPIVGPFNSNRVAQMKIEPGGLIRHSSSPAGLFANINIENEFGAMRAMGNFGSGESANAERTISPASRFKTSNQMDFSSRHASSSQMMDPISEIAGKGFGESSSDHGAFDDDRVNDVDYITGYPMNSWDDNFINDSNASASNDQKIEDGNRPPTRLTHHLSLPSSSAELSAMERLLQDSVPCKIRAKRGHATHPRSIAERVRRTKISERMRKLQELVPNMEKQTNTSDMLDLAVDYIKDLQRQVKTLSDNRDKCSCSAKQRN